MGMQHRYECYYNYERLLEMCSPYEDLEYNLSLMWEVILEFEKELDSCPEDKEELKSYTVEQLIKDRPATVRQPHEATPN